MRRVEVGRWLSGITVAAALLLPACSAMQIGAGTCQSRVSDRILNDYPQSRGSTFDKDVQKRQQGNDTILVSGRGRVRTKGGDYRHFTYSCVYNTRTERLSNVKYDIK